MPISRLGKRHISIVQVILRKFAIFTKFNLDGILITGPDISNPSRVNFSITKYI